MISRNRLILRRMLIAVMLFFLTLPAWGYVVFLKDGTQILTREKYKRDGERVVLVLESGTQTFIDAAEIDFEKTDLENANGAGRARIIESSQVEIQDATNQPPPRATLRDLAGSRNLAMPDAPQPEEVAEATMPLTAAGFVDLMALPRQPLADAELGAELNRLLASQGVDSYKLFQGTAPDRPLLEVVATNESAVFKALRDAAGAVAQLRARFPERLSALELLVVTERDVRAGQFTLTPELAQLLVRGGQEPETFFYRYVEF